MELLGFWEVAGSAAERLKSAEKKKAEGNELFKKGYTEEALFAYRESREYIIKLWNCEPEELEQARFLLVALYLNSAACHLKLKNYDHAIEVCKRALDRDGTNLKAYYRLGQAYTESGDFDQAIQFINYGLQVQPENPDLTTLLSATQKKKQRYLNDSKKIYKKMCG